MFSFKNRLADHNNLCFTITRKRSPIIKPFGVGKNYESKGGKVFYQVRSLTDIKKIINHFNKYPLITQKRADFELFKMVVELIEIDEHKTIEGLTQIVSLRASINNGLSDELKKSFPDIIPFARPLVSGQEIPDPNWLAGFVFFSSCKLSGPLFRVRGTQPLFTGCCFFFKAKKEQPGCFAHRASGPFFEKKF